jgi:hypothetical protein
LIYGRWTERTNVPKYPLQLTKIFRFSKFFYATNNLRSRTVHFICNFAFVAFEKRTIYFSYTLSVERKKE